MFLAFLDESKKGMGLLFEKRSITQTISLTGKCPKVFCNKNNFHGLLPEELTAYCG
jgi:hypothetical protein